MFGQNNIMLWYSAGGYGSQQYPIYCRCIKSILLTRDIPVKIAFCTAHISTASHLSASFLFSHKQQFHTLCEEHLKNISTPLRN